MKTLVIILTLSFAVVNLWAQEKLLEKPVKEVSLAEEATIVFDSNQFEYGEMEYGSDGNCVFTFTNTGKEPIMLTSVRASCGCTAPDWSKDPIKPGEKGEIKVKYNTHIVGPFSKTITVNSNGNPSQVILIIKGRVLPKPAEVVQN